jgi:hypothetical protein
MEQEQELTLFELYGARIKYKQRDGEKFYAVSIYDRVFRVTKQTFYALKCAEKIVVEN